MQLRMEMNDAIMSKIKDELGIKTNVEAVNIALSILNWAVTEVSEKRVILSAKEDGTDIKTLIVPQLEMAKAKAKAKAKANK